MLREKCKSSREMSLSTDHFSKMWGSSATSGKEFTQVAFRSVYGTRVISSSDLQGCHPICFSGKLKAYCADGTSQNTVTKPKQSRDRPLVLPVGYRYANKSPLGNRFVIPFFYFLLDCMFLDGLAFAIQIAVCCKEEFYGGRYWVQAINPEDKGVQVILGKRGRAL